MRGSRALLAGALVAAFAGVALHCRASGGSEVGSRGFPVYVLGADEGEVDFLSSSGGLQLILPAYLWSSFEVVNGKVSTTTDQAVSFRVLGRGSITTVGRAWCREVLVHMEDGAAPGRSRRVTVRLDVGSLLRSGAGVMQPGQAAIVEALQQARETSGMVRVGSIRLAGDTFVAGVEIR